MIRALAVAAAVGLLPQPVLAQSTTYATLTVSAIQSYDDNVFAASIDRARVADAIARVGPTLEAGYRSLPFTFTARYGFEAERYFDHTALSRGLARQDAALALRHQPSRRIAVDLSGSYRLTHTPSELNLGIAESPEEFAVGTALASRPARAERFEARSGASYAWSPVTTIAAAYEFTRQTMAGGIAADVQEARIGVERHPDARWSHRVEYGYRHFTFSDQQDEVWHFLTGRWTRAVTRRLIAEINAGPRLFDGNVRPEFGAILRRRFQNGELTAGYAYTQAVAIGETGAIDVQRVAGSAVYQAARRVTLSAAPAFASSSRGAAPVRVYGLDLEAAGRTRRGLSIVIAGRFGVQHGTLDGRRNRIPYRRLSIGLGATLPRPARHEGLPR